MARRLPGGGVWLGVMLALRAGVAVAQHDSTYISRDSAQHLYYLQEQNRARGADTARIRKDGFYRKVKEMSQRKKFFGQLYRFLFREPDNPLLVAGNNEKPKDQNLDRKFRRFNGRIIRHIGVKSLDVFGAKVYDTAAAPRNIFEKAGNFVHITSRNYVIRGQLSFKEGDRFRSTLVSNNERVLRQTGLLVDARIIPIPLRSKDSVDVLVITQDIFTLSGGVSPTAVDNVAIDVQERNFLGLNHNIALKYEYYGRAVPAQYNNFRAYYFVPYIVPRSFVSAEAETYYYYDRHIYRARVFKDFLFTTTRTAGSAEVRVSTVPNAFLSGDTVATYRVRQDVFDGWLGRAFPLDIGTERDDRVRLVVSGRLLSQTYRDRPFVSLDSNQIFRNRQLLLGSVGYVERDYFREVLINGYGRTEDVPYGLSFSTTFGVEHNEDGDRAYAGIKYAQSRLLGKAGYINYSFEAGSYTNYTTPEQGVIRFDALYFTPLIPLGHVHLRQFLRFRFVNGSNRFNSEYLTVGANGGVTGIDGVAFYGVKSLALNLETVAFFNFDLLSFKAAPFFQVDAGWAARAQEVLLNHTPFLGLGLGLRLYNERLTFNNIVLRLGYYPNVPDISSPYRPTFGRGNSFTLPDFVIGQPDVVRFQ